MFGAGTLQTQVRKCVAIKMTFSSTQDNNCTMACLVSIKNVLLLGGQTEVALFDQISRISFCVKLTNCSNYKTPAALDYRLRLLLTAYLCFINVCLQNKSAP